MRYRMGLCLAALLLVGSLPSAAGAQAPQDRLLAPPDRWQPTASARHAVGWRTGSQWPRRAAAPVGGCVR
jgi:hypothetical protein